MFKLNGRSDQEKVEKGETVKKNTRWQSSVLIFLMPEIRVRPFSDLYFLLDL
jgi:hypothetical protein